MGPGSRIVVLLVAAAAALAVGAAAAAEDEPETLHTSAILLVGEPGTVFDVEGHGRFIDTVEVYPSPDGNLVLVNELSFDSYVGGLAEMPSSWPMESLKAQAVAARTYAWHAVTRGTFHRRGLGFDICATVACQVFKGQAGIEGPDGDRWARAVAETSGEVVTWEGGPILARYFSSSGGHTRNNEDVFGPDLPQGPRPYLVGVPDPDEDISPHHRWYLTLTRYELDHLLSHGARMRHAVPVETIERVVSDGTKVDQIRAVSTSGTVVEVSASQFRAWVAEVGPELLPHRFPARTSGGQPLPDVLPSSRLEFCLDCEDGKVVIEGRGWGHGVGMSQWGARSKAERGMSYDDILAAYYNGLRPEVSPNLPERVRVGLTWTADNVEVTADGPFRVVTADAVSTWQTGETWRIEARDKRTVRAHGPSGEWVPREEVEPDVAEQQPEVPDPEPEVPEHEPEVAAAGPDVAESTRGDHLRRAVSYVAPVAARLLRLLAP
jgi:SpoIID/LytB domain protein